MSGGLSPLYVEELVYGLNIQIPNPRLTPDAPGDALFQLGPIAIEAAPQVLHPGESLYSPTRAFRLTFQSSDGNVVLQFADIAFVPGPWYNTQGLRITIANLGYMGSFVSRTNSNFCRTVLRLSDSVVTNTAHFYSRDII
jgi:hypothetical protein